MKQITKNTIWKITKIIWIMTGALILLWTAYWYVQMHLINNLGVIVLAVLFGIGFYGILAYIFITLAFLLIKLLIKK